MRKSFLIPTVILGLVFIARAAASANPEDLTLDAFLDHVRQHSQDLKAIDLDIESLRFEINARDLELSPTLAIELLRFWDERPSFSSNKQTTGRSVEWSLKKPLGTGTTINLLSGIETSQYQSTGDDERHLINWQLGISQSLWQNSFGRQTSLRRQADRHELQSRLLVLLSQRQETLIEFEQLYWDISYSQQEVKIRAQNLARSQEILEWMQDRVDRFAAQPIDLLQAQTLVAGRELQLQLAQDNLRTLEARLNEKIQMDSLAIAQDSFDHERNLTSLLASANFAPDTPVLIEALQSEAQAKWLEASANHEADKLKPILEVGYSYGQQGLDTTYSTARDDAFSRENDYHEVGLVFSVPLDFGRTAKSRQASAMKAKAQQARAALAGQQSRIQWADLQRTISEQKQKVQTARALAKLQNDKITEERSRLLIGKTTVFQAISFEQEAAESELLALQLLNQLRRREAQARLFIQRQETEK